MKGDSIDIGALYDASVDAYDTLYMDEQLGKYAFIFDHIGGLKGRTILDIGVGTGLYFMILSDNLYLIGLDTSFKSLEKAFKRALRYYVDLVYCDGEDPPIRLESIDVIVSVTTVHHFRDVESFLERMLSSEASRIYITFLDKVFNEDYMKKVASRYGCSYRHIVNDYILMCIKK